MNSNSHPLVQSLIGQPLIDCRALALFRAGHIDGAACLPAEEMPGRMHELPDNTTPVTLCGDAQSLQQASEFLLGKGYRLAGQIEWSEAFVQHLQQQGRLVTGDDSPRLWQPSPLVRRFMTEIAPAHSIVEGCGVDIACGAGRDLVYLAMHGWRMTGIDYRNDALKRVAQLAASQQVEVTTLERDLETGSDPLAEFADGAFDLVCVARYLHRPLFPYLKRILKPGGILLYQTFMVGAEQFGSPRNPHFLLKPGELAQIFAGAEILLDEETTLEDGRPVTAFVCRLMNDR